MSAPSPTRASTLELFFDLVFVFTITQVALIVEHHPSWESVAQATLELVVIFWMYGGFAWLTNTLGTETARQRTLLLAGMAAFFVVSQAVPRAFGDDGIAFGVAYLVLNVVHLGGFLSAEGATVTAMLRIGTTNLLGAVLILVAGFTHGGPGHWWLWGAAVLVQVLPPLLTRDTGAFEIGVAHFAERHGLMIIIVLGESLVSVAIAAQTLPLTAALVVGTLCGLAASAAMWWCYFAGDDDAAAEAFEATPRADRGRVALIGYNLTHLVMIAGVVAVAAGSRLSLDGLTEPASRAAASLIAAGAGLYLAGLTAFRALLRFATPWWRAAGAVVCAGTVPVGVELGAAQQLVAVAAVLVAVLLAERTARGGLEEPDRAG